MFGNTGHIHRKLTRAEQKAARLAEARGCAVACTHMAEACRMVGQTRAAEVLEEASRLLRRFGWEDK